MLADAGFRQVMPERWPKKPPTWGVGLACGAPFAPPAYEVSERTLGRPYTYCRHGVLIDHAFIEGFDESWSFRVAVLKSSEMEARCVTDNCPIALSVSKRP